MVLLLDIGNTFLKWTCLDGDSVADEGEIVHVDEEDLTEVFADAWHELTIPAAVYVANVAGEEFASELADWMQRTWQLTPNFVATEQEALGVRNAYQQPGQLGVDRWLAMLAAWNQLRGPVCVIDCGTALTVDAVDANGQHLGGLIVPGLGMMRDSLLDGTDGIAYDSDAEEEASDSLLAHSTRSGVEVGSLYALLAFIDRIINDLQNELGDEMQCILTGGDAEEIAPLLAHEVLHQPQLVLDGLALMVTELV